MRTKLHGPLLLSSLTLAGCAAPTEAELLERIQAPERGVRLLALQDMAVADNPAFLAAFRDAFGNPEPEFRRAAVIGLRSMHSDAARQAGAAPFQAVPDLVRALDDPDPQVRQLAAAGLDALGGDGVAPALDTLSVQLAPQDSEVPWSPSQRSLIARLSRLGNAALPGAVEVLGRGPSADGGPALGALAVVELIGTDAATATRELDSYLRQARSTAEVCAAARALGSLGAQAASAVPTLRAELEAERNGEHRDHRTAQKARRLALMAALGAAGAAAESAVPMLDRFADPGYPDAERIAAAAALGSIPGPDSFAALRKSLGRAAEGTNNQDVLAATLRGLGGQGPEARPALDEIRPFCTHEESEVRIAAIAAIGAMGRFAGPEGARSIGAALPLDDEGTRTAVVRAFAAMGPRVALPLLTEALDPDSGHADALPAGSWAGALAALAGLGDGAAAPALDDVLDFVRRGTRPQQQAAVPALGAMGPRAVPPLIYMLRNPEENANEHARPAVEQSLARLGRPAADALAELLGAPRAEIARAARDTLARIGAEAVPPLIAAVRGGPSVDAQRDAIQTLRDIGPEANDAEEVLIWALETRELKPYAEAALRAVRR